jgi:leucyl-tRNA synthetase
MNNYNFSSVEKKWQNFFEENKTFKTKKIILKNSIA